MGVNEEDGKGKRPTGFWRQSLLSKRGVRFGIKTEEREIKRSGLGALREIERHASANVLCHQYILYLHHALGPGFSFTDFPGFDMSKSSAKDPWFCLHAPLAV